METTGVEISTFLFTKENSVVAAVPMLILAISPMVSTSSGVSSSPAAASDVSASGIPPLRRALISSWDNTPSLIYSCSSLMTDVILTA